MAQHTITTPRTYSEKRAAQALNMPLSTLRLWRISNKLAASVFVEVGSDRPRPFAGRTDPIHYNADLVDAIAAGKKSWPTP